MYIICSEFDNSELVKQARLKQFYSYNHDEWNKINKKTTQSGLQPPQIGLFWLRWKSRQKCPKHGKTSAQIVLDFYKKCLKFINKKIYSQLWFFLLFRSTCLYIFPVLSNFSQEPYQNLLFPRLKGP